MGEGKKENEMIEEPQLPHDERGRNEGGRKEEA